MEATAEVSKTFNDKIRKYCDMTLLSCAYAGTGNVLKVSISFCQIYCNCKDFLIPNLASVIGPALSWSVCAAS